MADERLNARETTGAGAGESYREVTATHDATNEKNRLDVAAAIYGNTPSGEVLPVPVTDEGHLEMSIHGPTLPFGSVHAESLRPVFQTDAVYGINNQQVEALSSLSASVAASDSMFVLQTGVTSLAQATIQSRKRLRYRPDEGIVGAFTCLFGTPVASSYQLAGYGHAEDGYYIGYQGTSFGILYTNRGVRETRTLTVTVASTTTENVTVTLDGTAYTVAVTNSGNIQRTIWEISQGSFGQWRAYPFGATVVFLHNSAGPKTGTFSLAGTTATGTFARTKAGVASTDTFVAQSSWNRDKLDGTGLSSATLDPTKLNLYRIQIISGTGDIAFQIRIAPTGNNPTWVTFHSLRFPGTLTAPSHGNPSFPFTAVVYSAGSTTNLTMKVSAFSGFVEGEKVLNGPRMSYFNSLTTVGATNYQALFTVMNSRYYNGRSNQSVINILSSSGALKHTSPTIFYLIRNGSLGGNPNFTAYDSNSCSLFDSSATTVSITSNNQIVWSGHLGDTGNYDSEFDGGKAEEFTLQPGEWVTLAAKAVTGTPSYVTGSLNTREDQ